MFRKNKKPKGCETMKNQKELEKLFNWRNIPEKRQKEILKIVSEGIEGKLKRYEFIALAKWISEDPNRFMAIEFS